MQNDINISLDPILSKIFDLLETIRIYINNDGGDLEFVSYEDRILTLKISGACLHCSLIDQTFDGMVKHTFLEEIKEIKDVKFV